MTLPIITLAWQTFIEECNQSHHNLLSIVMGCLLVFILTLSQTSHTVQSFLSGNLANLLGADLVVGVDNPLTDEQRRYLDALSSQSTVTQSVTTVVGYDNRFQQIKLKAVEANYPIQGDLGVACALGKPTEQLTHGPTLGEIWLDSRVLASLNIDVGDQINVGLNSLRVGNVLIHEPDRLMEGHSVAMRGLVSTQTLAQLGLGNARIAYRYLFNMQTDAVYQGIEWQKENLKSATLFHKKGAHPLALFWKRTENVVGLVSIVLFFMAAIAIEQIAAVQIRKQQYFGAICMSVGASKYTVLSIVLVKWVLQLLALLPIALLVSLFCHYLLVEWLGNIVQGLVWRYSIGLFANVSIAMVLLFSFFQLPVWLALSQSKVGALIRANASSSYSGTKKACTSIVLALVVLVYSDNFLLSVMIVTSVVVCIVFIVVVNWIVLVLGEKTSRRLSGLLPFTLYMMRQRLVTKGTQVMGVGLCAFLLLFTLMFMRDLGTTMETYSREYDGNLLVSQANVPQAKALVRWADQKGAVVKQSKPYYYAKLVAINTVAPTAFHSTPSESMETFKNAVRLHFTDTIPTNNRVVAGQWWEPQSSQWQQVSIEQEVMTDLGLHIGDVMRFSIGNQTLDFTVVASHVYRSGGGSITFWVQMPASARDYIDASHYTMASLELHPNHFNQLGELWGAHPTLRMTSLNEMTSRFDTAVRLLTQAISGFSVVIVLFAIIVVLASVFGLAPSEKKKNSIIMSFGFSCRTCLKLNAIEWGVTGSVAALGAISATYLAGLMVYQSQFSMQYQPDFEWLVATLCVIVVCVSTLGIWANKQSLSARVKDLLVE